MIESENSEANGRLCGYSGCRAVLPETSGRGNRARYCQDGKTWGTKDLSCKQAAQAIENYRSLPGHDDRALDDTSVTALGEHVDRALGPVQALLTELTATRDDLDDAVTEALRTRAAAEERATDADGRAEAAEQRAAVAEQAAEEAESTAAAADRRAGQAAAERDNALAERDTAVTARNRAEARLEDARAREERADRRAQESADHAATVENRLGNHVATLTTERDSLSDLVAQLRAGLDAERERVAHAIAESQQKVDDLQARLDREREDHAAALNQVRAEAQADIERARQAAETETATARAELRQATHDYTTRLAELSQQLGAYEQRVRSLTEHTVEPVAEDGHR